MPKKKSIVEPIPQEWLDAVIPLLRAGDPASIEWSGRSQRDLSAVGLAFKFEAYEKCLAVLQTTGVLGEQISGMIDLRDKSSCETWAFLCPHPLEIPTPVYAKIGLHQGRLKIVFVSFHEDLSGKLFRAVQNYRKGKK